MRHLFSVVILMIICCSPLLFSQDAIGLPGFQFIQDDIEYFSRTWHSTMDVYDRVQADDVKQASIIMAAFAYDAAMRNEKLPKKSR